MTIDSHDYIPHPPFKGIREAVPRVSRAHTNPAMTHPPPLSCTFARNRGHEAYVAIIPPLALHHPPPSPSPVTAFKTPPHPHFCWPNEYNGGIVPISNGSSRVYWGRPFVVRNNSLSLPRSLSKNITSDFPYHISKAPSIQTRLLIITASRYSLASSSPLLHHHISLQPHMIDPCRCDPAP